MKRVFFANRAHGKWPAIPHLKNAPLKEIGRPYPFAGAGFAKLPARQNQRTYVSMPCLFIPSWYRGVKNGILKQAYLCKKKMKRMHTAVTRRSGRQPGRYGTENIFCSLVASRRQNLRRRQRRNSREDNKAGKAASRSTAAGKRFRWSTAAAQPYAATAVLPPDEEAYALARRISAMICYANALHYSKDYLLDVLRTVLKYYTGSKDVGSMAQINRQIGSELAKYAGYEVNRKELRTIWME
jgi:hypothetical protein